MRTRLAICHRKRRFVQEADALAVAEQADVTLRPYRCSLCRMWHLTSRTKGMKLPAFEVARRVLRDELSSPASPALDPSSARTEVYKPIPRSP